MTIRYVRSGATGSANGTSWANAYTLLATAFAAGAAGDTFYISEDHSETTASNLTLNSNGTLSNPTQVICVDHTGSVPPVAADLRTTAQISTNGFSNLIYTTGSTVYYGCIITAGSASLNLSRSNTVAQKFINCSLRVAGGNSGDSLTTSAGNNVSQYIELVNTTLSFSNVFQTLRVQCALVWRNTPLALLGTIPTNLFTFENAGKLLCHGVDLSAAGVGKTIVGAGTAGATSCVAEFIDCKIDPSVTFAAAPLAPGQLAISAMRVGASGVNYNQNAGQYAGTLVDETGVVLTGGASNGTTPLSWKIVTTANSTGYFPFVSPPVAIWNDVVGSPVTATIQGIWGGGAVPNNNDIWGEVEYLGDAASPQGYFVDDTLATILTAATALPAGAGVWAGGTTKFALGVTFTPQQKGWILFRVKAAKASSTFYVSPKIVLT